MPPETMTIVMPSAIVLKTAVCRATLARLLAVRKYGDAIESAMNKTIRLTNGSSF
jgi:hypothetical protein